MRSIVIGLAGAIGSGKTSIALGLANCLQCPIASFGAYVRDFAARTGRGNSREILQSISEELIASVGPDGLTQSVLLSAEWDRKHSLIVDGIRHPAVVAALKAEVAPLPVRVVYLDVRPEVRRERFVARDNLSSSDLNGFELHSTERDVGTQVRELADVVVSADGQVKDTVARVMNAIYP